MMDPELAKKLWEMCHPEPCLSNCFRPRQAALRVKDANRRERRRRQRQRRSLKKLLKGASKAPTVSLDVETTGLLDEAVQWMAVMK